MRQPDIFLIAHPRSGTHALTSMFAQKPNLFVFGEIFNPSPDSEVYPANYYYFLRAMQDTPLASPKNAETRFSAYLEHLRNRARNLRYLVDIKYDTLHLFDCELRDISSPPTIFAHLLKYNLPIVHLKRNILHIYFSHANAMATNQWQVMKGEEIRRPNLRIDVDEMMEYLTAKSFEQQQVSRFVRTTELHVEIWYEQLFGPGAADAFANLSEFLGVEDLAAEQPTVVKQITQPYEDLIENYDQVIAALKRSPFGRLLEPGRPVDLPSVL